MGYRLGILMTTDITKQLADALAEVMAWIDNWPPDFVVDDNWFAVHQSALAALAAYAAAIRALKVQK